MLDTWWAAPVNVGLGFLKGKAEAAAAKRKYAAQKAWQEYTNKMTNLSNALNQNAITTNERIALKSSTFLATQIKQQSMEESAQAAVSAAAAGVTGRSVRQSVMNIQRKASTAERNRIIELNNKFKEFDQQRTQSVFTAELNQDRRNIIKPNTTAIMLNNLSDGLSKGSKYAPAFFDKFGLGR